MRSVVLRSLAVIGVGAVFLAAVLYVASTVDARAPEVLEVRLTQPVADDAARALITTSLEVVFNEAVEPDGAARALRIEPAVEGSVSWSGSTMIFTPADPLELETEYEVPDAVGDRDLAGNEMVAIPPAFAFETAGRPTVVETDPTDGAVDVPVDGPIALRFSTLMDTASVEAELRLLPTFAHDLRWSGELLEIVPAEPMRPDREYTVTIGADAADIAGVALGRGASLAFRTVAPGLRAETIVPADGIDGIATTTPIAVIFDRPVTPDSVESGLLTIAPDVAGTLEVVGLPGDGPSEDGSGRVLRFTPSAPLPANTAFEVTLAPGVASASGGGLADELAWSFTTGAPSVTLSNQVTFLTDRAGVANVWAMNADGTGQRQLSVELSPVLDYAIAPDGTSLVVGDGRRLVFSRPDGSDRRVLTDEGAIEIDPAYHPNGDRLAFARADAATGAWLGLWEWEVGAGDASPIELPAEPGAPSPSDEAAADELRAPQYAPDGQALAFVDLSGSIGLLELSTERLTRVRFAAAGRPTWLPSGSALLVSGTEDAGGPADDAEAPVAPMTPGDGDAVHRLARSGTAMGATAFDEGWQVLAVAADGTIAYADGRGWLGLTARADSLAGADTVLETPVSAAVFAPGESALVVVLGAAGEPGDVERLDLPSGSRTPLAPEGWLPRWLP